MDLFSLHTISAVSTQGAPVKHSWVSSYLVHYSLGGVEWVVVTGQQQEIKVGISHEISNHFCGPKTTVQANIDRKMIAFQCIRTSEGSDRAIMKKNGCQ